MDNRKHQGMELLLICLTTGDFSVATISHGMRLGVATREYLPGCRRDPGRDQVLFDVARWRVLSESDTPLSARLDEGDTLVVAAPEDLPLGDVGDDRAIPIVESFEEARSRVRSFDQLTYVPQLFRCSVSVEEFEQLVSEAAGIHSRREAVSGERKLIADMIRTCDRAFTERHADQSSVFFNSLRNILRYRGAVHHENLSLFQHKIDRALSELNSRRAYHLLCNAAALHMEPALQSPQSLLRLSQTDELEIGEIRIDTTQGVRLQEISIGTVEQDAAEQDAVDEDSSEQASSEQARAQETEN